MKTSLLALTLGFLIDLAVGDPAWLYHPIRLVGNLIGFLDRTLRTPPKGKEGRGRALQEFLWGIVMALVVVIVSTGVPLLLLLGAQRIHPGLRLFLETIMCWQILATKSLKVESMKVHRALKAHDLEGARYAVSMIVGRDTAQLTEEEITRAAVETVAENTSDGVIAPMFYMAIGGAALGWFYKAVNTMDSMVGYKNEKYLYFGRFAARMDDVLNFIPARLAALFMILGAYLCGLDGKNAAKIFRRDRYNHSSPNSAQTEAVMAGALNVRLGGDAYYFGKRYRKKTIGDKNRAIRRDDIVRANHLLYATAVWAMLVFALLKGLLILFL